MLSTWLLDALTKAPDPVTHKNESCHALQVEVGSDGKPQDQRQIGLLGERVMGILLMPVRLGSFNLLLKVGVKAYDELACIID